MKPKTQERIFDTAIFGTGLLGLLAGSTVHNWFYFVLGVVLLRTSYSVYERNGEKG